MNNKHKEQNNKQNNTGGNIMLEPYNKFLDCSISKQILIEIQDLDLVETLYTHRMYTTFEKEKPIYQNNRILITSTKHNPSKMHIYRMVKLPNNIDSLIEFHNNISNLYVKVGSAKDNKNILDKNILVCFSCVFRLGQTQSFEQIYNDGNYLHCLGENFENILKSLFGEMFKFEL